MFSQNTKADEVKMKAENEINNFLPICLIPIFNTITSVSDPDPHWIRTSMNSWIRIRMANADPDGECGSGS
jgi:hypothetical protein